MFFPFLYLRHFLAPLSTHARTQISFWQNECPADTCPALGDGSFAAVFPVDDSLENQSAMVEDDSSDGKESLFWFVVVAAGLLMLAVLTWCSYCLCCGVSGLRPAEFSLFISRWSFGTYFFFFFSVLRHNQGCPLPPFATLRQVL